MRKFLFISLLSLLLALPSMGVAQFNFGGAHTSVSLNSASTTGSGNPISPAVIQVILTQSAPYFGIAPADFINLYENCGCITIEQIGPNTYYVTYGGLGITIIIDGSRTQGPNTGISPGTKR